MCFHSPSPGQWNSRKHAPPQKLVLHPLQCMRASRTVAFSASSLQWEQYFAQEAKPSSLVSAASIFFFSAFLKLHQPHLCLSPSVAQMSAMEHESSCSRRRRPPPPPPPPPPRPTRAPRPGRRRCPPSAAPRHRMGRQQRRRRRRCRSPNTWQWTCETPQMLPEHGPCA